MIKLQQRNRIKSVLILIIMGLLLTSFFGCNNPDPPKLVLSEASWHFGEVPPDEQPSHAFRIKNEGDQKLIIESAYSSCACVILELPEKEIEPGEEAELIATFDPYGYEGDVTKNITLKTNDPENPEKIIETSITVLRVPNPDIELSQQTFNLGDLSSSGKQEIVFTITNSGDADLIIQEVITEDIFGHNINTPLIILPEEEYAAEFSIDISQLKEGEFRKAVRIMTNDPQNAAVFLRITGNIKDS